MLWTPTANPKEVATLIVNGRRYEGWETVWAQERWTEAFTYFRFTAAEVTNPPASYHDAQVIPCDDVTLMLGGEQVVKGTVITRQTSYNATQHMVQITGKGLSFWTYKSSVDTLTGNFDNMNIKQIAEKVLAPYQPPKWIGTPDMRPFEHEQAQSGETIWDFLDRLCRQRKCILGSDRQGNVQIIGDHEGIYSGSVVEGVNIKAMQCTISVEDTYESIRVTTTSKGDDDANGQETNQPSDGVESIGCRNSILIIESESAGKKEEALLRAQYEKIWTEGTKITANVTVQGWFSDMTGHLWEAGTLVNVQSDMAMLHGTMKLKTVTWTQDNNNGTQTVLELVEPWALLDAENVNVAYWNDRPQNTGSSATANTPKVPLAQQAGKQDVPGGKGTK